MKAAVLAEWNKLEIREVPCPAAGPGEAVIRVAYTGICASDMHAFRGKHPLAHPGMILGHEFSGVVAELGSPCEGIKPGDKVCAHILEYCGRCDACKKGFHNLCRSLKVLGTQSDGTFAEYVKVGIDKLFRLPDDADLRVYALAEPRAVGVYATDRIGVALADTALVIGAGPIGLCCAFAARKAGASRVVLSEVVLEKIEFARSLGFEVIDVGSQDLLAAAEAYTDGVGFDHIYETSGRAVSTESLTKIGSVRGSAILVAYTNDPSPIDSWNLMRREMQISSIRVHPQSAYEAAVNMMLHDEAFRRQMTQLITRDYDFAHVQDAFEAWIAGTSKGKIMVKITE